MKSRAAFLSLLCWLCVQCEPARERTPTRPPVRDVLASFEADRPKESAFNRLSEEEKWEFLRLYLPNRVFSRPPSTWIKFLPDGTAPLVLLVGGVMEPAGSVRWDFVEGGGLRLRPMKEGGRVQIEFFPVGTFVEPTMRDEVLRFKDTGGEPAMSFNLIHHSRVLLTS